MRTTATLALLGALALGAAPQDEKPGPKSKEVRKAFAAFMKEIGKEDEGLKKDLEEKKGDAAAKARLEKIKKAAEGASKLDYLKGTEDEVVKFKALFEILIDVRMKSFAEATWDAENGEKLYERLQLNCRTCHELFRSD
jgi:cytochrome c556